MSRSLHTGKIYRIGILMYGKKPSLKEMMKWITYNCNHGMFGGDGQEAFYNILSMFDIANSAEDEFDDDYEVQRIELERLRTIIGEENETYQAHAEEFHEELNRARTSKEDFINMLDLLIKESDPSNDWVLISWF